MIPSPVKSTVPPYRWPTVRERLSSSLITSRDRSVPNAEAMSIDRTTSANRTVTCLNSGGRVDDSIGDPQASQNLAPSPGSVPQFAQTTVIVRLSLPAQGRAVGAPVDLHRVRRRPRLQIP